MDYKDDVIRNFTDAVIILHDKILGKGNFGEVKEGLLNGKKVAVKIPHTNLVKQVTEENKRELNIMTQLSHRNIVKLLGVINADYNSEPKLVFEYVENGSLVKYVSSGFMEQNTLIRLCYDIVCGMAYLHSRKYIHRDLAARNVLVDAMHRAKVADFGLSRFIDVDNNQESCYYFVDGNKPLPVRWSPKETIEAIVSLGAVEGKFSFPSDVWSFGVTMWEVWSGGSTPYTKNGNPIPSTLVIDYIHEGKNPNSFDTPENAPVEMLSIMEEVFQVERQRRPTFNQLQTQFENTYGLDMLLASEIPPETGTDSVAQIKHVSVIYAETTWWPSKKVLVQALQRRKVGNQLLIERLHDLLLNNRRKMTVICQSEPTTHYSGFKGVGKSLTAKWYANHFEKQYQRILWIDAGEGSLLKSFKYLARDMGLTNRNELHDLARGCYEGLSTLKCLWIFDNVESYMGDHGIHTILPTTTTYPMFVCFITSRSRENWGKDNGYGEISKFEIDVFTETESVDFLKSNLNPQIPFTDYQLRQLSDLLGNFPLALQLALATLNFRKVDVQHYIDQISTAYDFNIVSEKFDDYETTINKTVLIILEQIQKEPKGKLASKVLTICGYIRSNEIQFDFLKNISGINTNDLHACVEILLKYSLITKSGTEKCMSPYTVLDKLLRKIKVEVDRDIFSINPLMQQVIRHNEKKTENETIRRILNYRGYLEYKMIPYLHANDNIKTEFKDVKARLIDQAYLENLIASKSYKAALELCRFIHLEINSDISMFNYAKCLDLQGEQEEAAKIFKQLQAKLKPPTIEQRSFQTGVLPLNSQLTKLHIQTALLWQAFRAKNIHSEVMDKEPAGHYLTLSLHFEELKGIVQSLESCCINCYSLQCTASQIELQIDSDVGKPQMKKMLFNACSIQNDIELPQNLKRLSFSNVKFKGENNEEIKYDFSHLLKSNIEQLYVTQSEISLCWNAFATMSHVDVRNCKIILPLNPVKIDPKILRLEDVQLFQNSKEMEMANLNDLIFFQKIQKLHLCASDNCTKFSIEMKHSLTAKEVKLLDNTQVLNWKNAKWNIQKLVLKNVSLIEKNQLKITELETNSPVDVCCIPKTIQKIKMDEGASFIDSSYGNLIDFPKLKLLHLCDMPHPSSTLSLFLICRSLGKLKLQLQLTFTIRLELSSVPKTVSEIEIISNYNMTSIEFVGQLACPLNILTVDNLECKSICDMLKKVKTEQLVIHCNKGEASINELMSSIKKLPIFIPKILISTNRKEYYEWRDQEFLI